MEKCTLQAQLEQAEKDRNKINDEIVRLRKEIMEGNIPKTILVGQVYKTQSGTHMIAALGENTIGLTSVGCFPGCYTSVILIGSHTKEEIREVLVNKKAVYLGHFFDVFVKRECKNG